MELDKGEVCEALEKEVDFIGLLGVEVKTLPETYNEAQTVIIGLLVGSWESKNRLDYVLAWGTDGTETML